MNNTSEEKKKVEEAYSQFSTLLQESKDSIQKIQNSDNRFEAVKKQYLTLFEAKILESCNMLDTAIKYQEWDNLVVAFFGVTNAGKSTIIETFRILFDEETRRAAIHKSKGEGVDGAIVGDGKMDFTKAYEEYKMSIDGKQFVLIDVPGIEGKESEVKDEILKALGKAHCVFCVHGLKEKPDSKVIERVKTYLKDWVKVYSILNIKGTSFNYDEEDERKEFKTKNVCSLEEQTKQVFTEALGKHYAGNYTIQALLALCAKAHFSPNRIDLIKEQKELLNSFKSPEAILEFCNFNSVVEVIRHLSVHYSEEICEAHKTKVRALYKTTFQSLKELNSNQKTIIDQIIVELQRYEDFVDGIFSSKVSSIKNQIKGEIVHGFDVLKKDGYKAIDDGLSGEKLESFFEDRKGEVFGVVDNNIKVIIHNEAIDLNDALQQATDQLKKNINTIFSVNLDANIEGVEVEISEALSKLDFGFGDFMNWVWYLGGAFMVGWSIAAGANWWNPVGWAIAAIMAAIAIFGDGKEKKAKNKLSESIDEAQKQCMKTNYIEICKKIDLEFNKKKRKICSVINKNIKSLETFKSEIDETMDTINKYNYKLNNTEYGKL
jgi:molybdopterin-guanine dinucleotide biosynthesis protein